jgi:LysR family glycine cleavage system transcriptional activator
MNTLLTKTRAPTGIAGIAGSTRLPSLKLLRTFQVAGRYLSFKDAAEELSVTASAVSHQVRNLELELQVQLFTRGTRSVALTGAGKIYFEFLDGMFRRLEDETARVSGMLGRKTVHLCVPPFFASEVLLPRLQEFNERSVSTDIRVSTQPTEMKSHSAEADLTVVLAPEPQPDLIMHRLFARRAIPACSPRLIKELGINKPQDLNDQVLIVHEKRKETWQQWSKSVGISEIRPRKLMRFDSMADVVHAAEQSLGIALISWPLSENRVVSGSLVRLFDEAVDTGEDFYLAYREEVSRRKEVGVLINWIIEKFRRDA